MLNDPYLTWLEGLKAGDEVFCRSSGGIGGNVPYPGKVARTTPKTITLESGVQFWRKNGRRVGGDAWRWTDLEQPSKEGLAEIRVSELRVKARDMVEALAIPKEEAKLKAFIAAIQPYVKLK